MAFWKKKENEREEKCPLCGTVVSIEDIECPLCFYELKVSPRHQTLNITANEEDSLIGLLNSDLEDEEDDELIREVEDVINLDAQEITVEAEYDDDEFISIPSEHAPEFITSRMTPSGVVETDATPKEMSIENDDDDDIDLGGITIPKPPSNDEIEYEDLVNETEEDVVDSLAIELPPPPVELPPPPVELPPPPAELPPPPAELPPPPAELAPPPAELAPPPAEVPSPTIPEVSPYTVETPVQNIIQNSNNEVLSQGVVWPWAPEDEWNSKHLRSNLLEAMAAAKNGENKKVEDILEQIGPHLGKNIELLFHIGVLLKRLGREYELVQMLTKAQAQFPGNSDVENAVSKLS